MKARRWPRQLAPLPFGFTITLDKRAAGPVRIRVGAHSYLLLPGQTLRKGRHP